MKKIKYKFIFENVDIETFRDKIIALAKKGLTVNKILTSVLCNNEKEVLFILNKVCNGLDEEWFLKAFKSKEWWWKKCTEEYVKDKYPVRVYLEIKHSIVYLEGYDLITVPTEYKDYSIKDLLHEKDNI